MTEKDDDEGSAEDSSSLSSSSLLLLRLTANREFKKRYQQTHPAYLWVLPSVA